MTWDEMVEIAARVSWEQLAAGRRWETASAMEQTERRIEANAALRALIAAGVAFVREDLLNTIRDWTADGTEDQPDSERSHVKAGRVTTYMTLGDLRALSAGEIKPEEQKT